MLYSLLRSQVRAKFGDQLQRECRAKVVDLSKIGAEHALSAARTSNEGALICLPFVRALGMAGMSPSALTVSAATAASSLRSQSSILVW